MRPEVPFSLTLLAVLSLSGCKGEPRAREAVAAPTNILEVTATDRTLQAPDTVQAGWITFRFENASTVTHFTLVERLPDSADIARQQNGVTPIFQAGYDPLAGHETEARSAKLGELSVEAGNVVFLGGTGLTGPGRTSQTTVKLEPGTYLLECYVKSDGAFRSYDPDHTHYGVVHRLTVTGPASPVLEPRADITLALSSRDGIQMSGQPTAGEHTVAVHFGNQKVSGSFVGHDVHLVRLKDDTDLDRLVAWMDGTDPGGLETPAPAEFLGGVNEMPAASTGYMTVSLEPGRYAWIAEAPQASEQGILREFTVPATD